MGPSASAIICINSRSCETSLVCQAVSVIPLRPLKVNYTRILYSLLLPVQINGHIGNLQIFQIANNPVSLWSTPECRVLPMFMKCSVSAWQETPQHFQYSFEWGIWRNDRIPDKFWVVQKFSYAFLCMFSYLQNAFNHMLLRALLQWRHVKHRKMSLWTKYSHRMDTAIHIIVTHLSELIVHEWSRASDHGCKM